MLARNAVLLLLCLSACSPRAVPVAEAGTRGSTQEVLDAQRRRFAAMLRQDLDALADILADDLTYTHTSANLEGKEAFLRTIGGGTLRYAAIEPSDVRVRQYGTTAIVDGRARFRVVNREGRESEFSVRFTEVLLRRDGRWQTVSWQSTRFPE